MGLLCVISTAYARNLISIPLFSSETVSVSILILKLGALEKDADVCAVLCVLYGNLLGFFK